MDGDIQNKSFNQEKSQLVNRSLVLGLLRQESICSRARLAQLSGLKQTTITNIINEFIDCDLVIETGLMTGNKGRRSIGLRLNDERFKVIGVRMTRTSFYVCTFGLSGKIFGTKQYIIRREENVQITIIRIRTAVQVIRNEYPESDFLAVAMAMPGPYREDQDRLLFVTELSGWQNFPIKEALTRGMNIPVYIVNDANASALAQAWYRKEKPPIKNLIYVLAGEGVGCGIIDDGKLVTGSSGIAGEFGHNTINFEGPKCECGNRGCLEKYCSFLILQENIDKRLRSGEKSLLSGKSISPITIAKAVQEGDHLARSEFKKACNFLAVGIVNLINQFNPGLIVIGDELTQIDPDLLLKIVTTKVHDCINPLVLNDLTIEINRLEESPCLLGAGVVAMKSIFADPAKLMNRDK